MPHTLCLTPCSPRVIINMLFLLLQNQKQSMILKQDDASNNNIILDQEVLSMEPVLKAQPKLLSLDDKILLSVARANVLSQISVSTVEF